MPWDSMIGSWHFEQGSQERLCCLALLNILWTRLQNLNIGLLVGGPRNLCLGMVLHGNGRRIRSLQSCIFRGWLYQLSVFGKCSPSALLIRTVYPFSTENKQFLISWLAHFKVVLTVSWYSRWPGYECQPKNPGPMTGWRPWWHARVASGLICLCMRWMMQGIR